MKRTTNFFLIHNYNTVPTELTALCEDYIIYDCSTDETVKRALEEQKLKVKHIENTGHNITSYFSYFAEHYDHLPEVICLLKGNMIGRHCSMAFFREVYDNKSFTFLYDEKQYWDKFAKYTRGGVWREKCDRHNISGDGECLC